MRLVIWEPSRPLWRQCNVSNGFSSMQIIVFWFQFYWGLYHIAQLMIVQRYNLNCMAWRWGCNKPLSELWLESLSQLGIVSPHLIKIKARTTRYRYWYFLQSFWTLINVRISSTVIILMTKFRFLTWMNTTRLLSLFQAKPTLLMTAATHASAHGPRKAI